MYGEHFQITILKASNGFSVNINRPMPQVEPGLPFNPEEMIERMVKAKNRVEGESWKDLQDGGEALFQEVPKPLNEILVFTSFEEMVEQLRREFE